jgi:2-polyprenyl-6-methoxyphenol hydroxylase-like FAD-dependent oxidoreductase
MLGIDRPTLERGVKFKAANIWLRGEHAGRVPFADMGPDLSQFPYALIFPQDLHEQLLVEQLERLGVAVERNTELLDFTAASDSVAATLRKDGVTLPPVSFTYLAGCDGARSTVRQKLNVGFDGGTYDNIFYVADVQATSPVVNGEVNIALDDADFVAIFPMNAPDHIRLVGVVTRDEKNKKEFRWEDVDRRILDRLKINVQHVKWFSTYHVHHRVASHFRQQNVFILGDAAHVHSPVGGQGMNTGIGDAVNLAWKLGAVLQRRAPASILDTFEPERIAFARRLVASTDRAFTFINAHGSLATQVRLRIVPRLLPALFGFAASRRLLFKTISQININYRHSPLSAGHAGPIHAGDRLPWFQFSDASDNFAPLASRQWQLHVYGEASPALSTLCTDYTLPLHVFSWQPDMHHVGLRQNAAYLIRPDGYTGLVEPHADSKVISAYLDHWVKSNTHS